MKKGIFYSVMTIILLIPIITLSSAYSETLMGYGTNIGSNVRMKSGLYFMDSVNEDFDRAVEIVGRRSITACINEIINTGSPMPNPDERIMELMENKTLNGTQSELVDYSIYDWLNRSDGIASRRGFYLEREIKDISITMEDPWNVMVVIDMYVKLQDKKNVFSYEKNFTRNVPVSLVGLEDPLYILNTDGRVSRKIKKYEESDLTELLLSGSGGNLWGSGITFKTSSPGSLSDKDEKIIIKQFGDDDYQDFAGAVFQSNTTEIECPYIEDALWDSLPNNTRVVLEGDEGQVWSIQKLYNLHDEKMYIQGEGPSFLDRMEGTISNTYPGAGLESLVKKEDMLDYTYEERSNVDYIYFNGSTNINSVKGMPEDFRIDPQHEAAYGVNNTLSYP